MKRLNFSSFVKLINRWPKATLVAVFILATAIFYGYFWFLTPHQLQIIYQNWDGPAFVVIAKSFYDPEVIKQVNTIKVGEDYFAAHFPLYALTIRIFSFMGYFRAMLFSSLLFSLLFILAFFELSKMINKKINSLYICLALVFLTPRWFIVSHVGSSEPLFLFLITLSLIFLTKKKYLVAALCVSLAQTTRIQAAFFVAGLGLYYLYLLLTKKIKLRQAISEFLPFVLVPLSLIGVFTLYFYRYGDFLAIFNAQSWYQHLYWPPFQVFSKINISLYNVWKESYIYTYLISISTIVVLFKKKLNQFAFIAIGFLVPLLLEVHVDVSRYALVMLPFIFLAHSDLLTNRSFRISLLLVLPAIYLYSINYASFNITP